MNNSCTVQDNGDQKIFDLRTILINCNKKFVKNKFELYSIVENDEQLNISHDCQTSHIVNKNNEIKRNPIIQISESDEDRTCKTTTHKNIFKTLFTA